MAILADPVAARGTSHRLAEAYAALEAYDRVQGHGLLQLRDQTDESADGDGGAALWPHAETAVCLHEIFEQQADLNPAAAALECGGRVLSYAALDVRLRGQLTEASFRCLAKGRPEIT